MEKLSLKELAVPMIKADEIDDMVKQCYAHSFEEYYSGRS
ncbi:hypothetical protein Dalk_0860 [Desulfatibacillum aliphaticivorans]|uniref:Uncharacterized protein n=1 Tax=Desulfatibacillum aliphaticivorans TaxID=218208 RepID=B8FHZ8_DESAL|nr:hypothetical protein Dalk_0860 [Desulfatibacillum aliphaticivorans]